MDDIVITNRQTERQRTLDKTKKTQSAQMQAMTLGVNTALTRERKTCNYCSKLNPFFRFDCFDCGCKLEKKYIYKPFEDITC